MGSPQERGDDVNQSAPLVTMEVGLSDLSALGEGSSETRFAVEEWVEVTPDSGPDAPAGPSATDDTRWDEAGESPSASGQSPDWVPPEEPAGFSALPLPNIEGYEIEGELGRGGMGVVYKARRVHLNRACALKMIRAGMYAGTDLLARFKAEAEAAAQLQHPNVVQVYHIGEAGGLPYLEMEYVPGGGLDRALRGTPRPPRAAAELVVRLARAVHAAHELGIVHRDLKPANILLTSDGTPKVADFGLAKCGDSGTQLTHTECIIGTPSYMAPEQAGGGSHRVGPPADIYALGSILYEILVGRPPFRAATVMETLEQVRTAEPVPPSRLEPGLSRDLETICLKCLAKVPSQRYDSAEALADDLQRFLDDRPILARPVSSTERAWRWCRRNPLAARLGAAVAALLVLLFVGAVVAVISLDATARKALDEAERAERASARARSSEARALKEARRANAEAETSGSVARFLTGLFDETDPIGIGSNGFRLSSRTGAKLSARELIDRGVERLQGETIHDPKVRASLLQTLGNVYISFGEIDSAERLLQTALELRRKALPPDDPELAATLHALGLVRTLRYNTDGEPYYRSALAIRRKAFGGDHLLVAETMFSLGLTLKWAGHGSDAEGDRLMEAALAIRRKKLGDRSREVAATLLFMAHTDLNRDREAAAIPRILEATRILDELRGGRDLGSIVNGFVQARLASQLRNYRGALQRYRACAETAESLLGADHVIVGAIRHCCAQTEHQMRDYAAAERSYRSALATCLPVFGENHELVGSIRLDLARCVRDAGDIRAAWPIAHEALKTLRKTRSNRLRQALHVTGVLDFNNKDFESGVRLLHEAVDLAFAEVDTNPELVATILTHLGFAYRGKGDEGAAIESFDRAREVLVKAKVRITDRDSKLAELERLRSPEQGGH